MGFVSLRATKIHCGSVSSNFQTGGQAISNHDYRDSILRCWYFQEVMFGELVLFCSENVCIIGNCSNHVQRMDETRSNMVHNITHDIEANQWLKMGSRGAWWWKYLQWLWPRSSFRGHWESYILWNQSDFLNLKLSVPKYDLCVRNNV